MGSLQYISGAQMTSDKDAAEQAALDAWLDPDIQPQDPIGLPTFRILYCAGFISGCARVRAGGVISKTRPAGTDLNPNAKLGPLCVSTGF
jgi:hypothetical protein